MDVHFENCLYLNDSLIENLLKNSPNLMKLNILKNISIKQPKIYSNSLQSLSLIECQNLKNLQFWNQEEEEEEGFVKDVKQENLMKCEEIKDDMIESEEKKEEKNENLKLIDNSFMIPPLKSLSFRQCPNLILNSYSKSKKLTFEKNSIEFFECSKLKNLSIESDALTLVSCQNLKNLNFESNGNISIHSCSTLKEIKLSEKSENLDLQVTNCNQLMNVFSNNSLRSIQLSNCEKITDESIEFILNENQNQNLNRLIIENCSLIKPFIKHSNLSKFHLRKCFHLIDFHTECPNLEEFELFDLPNISKNIDILNQINKNSLNSFENLKKIIFRSTRFSTFENLKNFLKKMKKLKEIQITGITNQQKKELRDSMFQQNVIVY